MFGVGQGELLLILLAVLILFGAKRIPEVARSLGKGLADFRDAMSGFEREVKGEPPIRKEPPKELAARPAEDSGPGGAEDAPAPAPAPAEGAVPAGDRREPESRPASAGDDPAGQAASPDENRSDVGRHVTDRRPLPEEEGISREPAGEGRPPRSQEDAWPEDPYRHLNQKPGPGQDLQG